MQIALKPEKTKNKYSSNTVDLVGSVKQKAM